MRAITSPETATEHSLTRWTTARMPASDTAPAPKRRRTAGARGLPAPGGRGCLCCRPRLTGSQVAAGRAFLAETPVLE